MTAAKMGVRMKDKLMRNVLPVSYYADVQQSRASAFTRDPDEEPWAPSDQASGAHEAFGPLEKLSSGALYQRWQLKYFYLEAGRFGYADDRASKVVTKWLDLRDCDEVQAPRNAEFLVQCMVGSPHDHYVVQFDELGSKPKRLSRDRIEPEQPGAPLKVGTRVRGRQKNRKSSLMGRGALGLGTILEGGLFKPVQLRARDQATASMWVRKLNASRERALEARVRAELVERESGRGSSERDGIGAHELGVAEVEGATESDGTGGGGGRGGGGSDGSGGMVSVRRISKEADQIYRDYVRRKSSSGTLSASFIAEMDPAPGSAVAAPAAATEPMAASAAAAASALTTAATVQAPLAPPAPPGTEGSPRSPTQRRGSQNLHARVSDLEVTLLGSAGDQGKGLMQRIAQLEMAVYGEVKESMAAVVRVVALEGDC